MKHDLKFLAPITILGLLFLYNCNFFSSNDFGNVSEFVVAVVSLVGLVQLFSTLNDLKIKRKRESDDYAFSIQDFFREKVIKTTDDIDFYVSSNGLFLPDIKNLSNSMTFSVDDKELINKNDYSAYMKLVSMTDKKFLNYSKDLFNQIEQLSTKIIISKNNSHPAMMVIKKAYISMIESHSPMLYFLVNELKYSFAFTLELYKEWKK